MKVRTFFTWAAIIVLSILFGFLKSVQLAEAAPCIPEDADVYSATFSISLDDYTGEKVRTHRVTAP